MGFVNFIMEVPILISSYPRKMCSLKKVYVGCYKPTIANVQGNLWSSWKRANVWHDHMILC